MPKHAFLFLTVILTGLVILTNPAFLSPLLPQKQAPVNTPTPSVTHTPTATATPDPFADVPTATPFGQRSDTARVLPTLPPVATQPPTATRAAPTPSAGQLPQPPTETRVAATVVLPDTSATVRALPVTAVPQPPPPPTPVSPPPTRLVIPRLSLDAPVEPVGMVPSSVAPGVFEWGTPDHRAAGWLNTTAPLGVPGNTVLDGHNNINGEVFRDLWTLQPGDEITLFAGETARHYTVQDVLILPERDQPLAVRLRNARYILPTADERLTLVTCYPYESNTHRVIVIALPQ